MSAPLVARSWRPWCVAALVAAVALVAVLGVTLHDRQTPTSFDNWVARPLFDHISKSGGRALLALSASPITLGVLAVVALVGVRIRSWELVALVLVGPTAAVVATEFVLKPLVHRRMAETLPGDAFPSGHEAGLASMLLVLLLLLPRAGLGRRARVAIGLGLALWAVLAAVGLVRANWHLATDTIGAIGVAVGCVVGTALLIDALSARVRQGEAATTGQFT